MLVEEAREKTCPYLNKKCIIEECMFWETTLNGKKEIDRKIVPHDLYPMEESNWRKNVEKDGYVNSGRLGAFRDVFIKSEESFEGFCKIAEIKQK